MKSKKTNKIKSIYILLPALLMLLAIAIFSIARSVNYYKELEGVRGHYDDMVKMFENQNESFEKGQIVFIGDSITEGYDLGAHYSSLSLATYNRGIGGDTTIGVLARLRTSLFAIAPSKIVIMIGTNDLNGGRKIEEIMQNHREIVMEIRKTQPTVDIFFVSIAPHGQKLGEDFPLDIKKNNENIIKLNENIKQICDELGCTYVDIHSSLLDQNGDLSVEYTDDGLHLNKNGYAIWTSILKPLLEK